MTRNPSAKPSSQNHGSMTATEIASEMLRMADELDGIADRMANSSSGSSLTATEVPYYLKEPLRRIRSRATPTSSDN